MGALLRSRTEGLAAGALLLLTIGWGSTFFLIKGVLTRIPVLDYLGMRFLIATLVLALFAPRAVRRLPQKSLVHGVVLGVLYGVAQILQTMGIDRTPASVAGFVTGLYVVMTPLLAAPLLRQRIAPVTWAAVLLATAGMGVLTLQGLHVGYGELVILGSAVLYALHICGLGSWSTPETAVGSSIIQLGVIAVISLIGATPGGLTLPHRSEDWAVLLYMGIVVGGLGLLGQVWGQAHLPPTRSAVIMSMEPVFAALFATTLGNDTVSSRMILGGLMVLAAMLLVELGPRESRPEVTPLHEQ